MTSSPRPTWATTSMSPSNASSAASASLIITWSSASSSRTGSLFCGVSVHGHRPQLWPVAAMAAAAGTVAMRRKPRSAAAGVAPSRHVAVVAPARPGRATGGRRRRTAARTCRAARCPLGLLRVLVREAAAVIGDLEGQLTPAWSASRMRQCRAREWRITLVTASRRHQASTASASGSNVPDRSVSPASSSSPMPAASRAFCAVMTSIASVGLR